MVMENVTENMNEEISLLIADLEKLRNNIVEDADERLAPYKEYFPNGEYTGSACNLAHYLSLRRFDLRPLQTRLTEWGLSSLGRGEPHVLLNLDRVLSLLRHVTGIIDHIKTDYVDSGTMHDGAQILERHTEELFGTPIGERSVRIMVTLPSEAAWNFGLVKSLFG